MQLYADTDTAADDATDDEYKDAWTKLTWENELIRKWADQLGIAIKSMGKANIIEPYTQQVWRCLI